MYVGAGVWYGGGCFLIGSEGVSGHGGPAGQCGGWVASSVGRWGTFRINVPDLGLTMIHPSSLTNSQGAEWGFF